MVLKILVILIIVAVAALIANAVEDSHNNLVSIPFKDSINSFGVPIATFKHNNKELNFLLDTGGDYSYIDSTMLDLLNPKSISDGSISVVTGSGSMHTSGRILLEFYYKNNRLEEEFIISDIRDGLDLAFGSGMTVHGVLGSSFFDKYGCIIDFNDYITVLKK